MMYARIGIECLALDCAFELLRNENVSASVSVNIINTKVKCFSETMINGPHNDCEDENDIDSGDVVTDASDDILEPTWRVILFIHEPIPICPYS